MSDALRWALLLPAALVGWYAALIGGLLMLSAAEAFCPPEAVVSGACRAPWFDPVSAVVFAVSAAGAAALVVLLPSWLAPAHRARVAWIAFALGAGLALAMGVSAGAYVELASALAAGALAAVAVARRAAGQSLLAGDHVLAFHFAFVLFAVFGGLLVIAVPAVAWLHVPAVLWSSVVNLAGWTCPLTPLEKRLREREGGRAYDGGFVTHYLGKLVYPLGMPRRMELFAGVAIVVWNVIVYAGIGVFVRY